jgi:hypothetical protein
MKLLLVAGLTILSLACTQPRSDAPGTGSPAQQSTEPADPRPDAERSGQVITADTSSLGWLIRNSPLVFVGRLRARSGERDARGLFVTTNRFDVERVIAGTFTDKMITLRVLGGTVDGETLRVPQMPEFTVDRRYVIFTDAARTVYNPITGNQRGVFLLVNDSVYTYDGRAVVGIEGGVLRTGASTLRAADAPGTAERGGSQAADPKTSGAILSMQRAAEPTDTPMTLDAFSRAVADAARR